MDKGNGKGGKGETQSVYISTVSRTTTKTLKTTRKVKKKS